MQDDEEDKVGYWVIAIKNKFLLGMVGTLALVQVLLEDDQEEH